LCFALVDGSVLVCQQFCNAVEEETNNLLKPFSSPLKYICLFLFVPAGVGFSRSKGEERRGEER